MANIRSIINHVENKLWVISYQLEDKKIVAYTHLAKLKTTTRQAIRRLHHGRR